MTSTTDGFLFDDGGRAAAGFKGSTGDCVARSIAIATGLPYQQVYDDLNACGASERTGKRKRGKSNARTGVYKPAIRKYLASLGWTWVPTMQIGSGCTVHLVAHELPVGRIIVSVSRHLTTMIDGVIHDTHDPRRDTHCTEPYREPMPNGFWTHDKVSMHHVERRCVYGYWLKSEAA